MSDRQPMELPWHLFTKAQWDAACRRAVEAGRAAPPKDYTKPEETYLR